MTLLRFMATAMVAGTLATSAQAETSKTSVGYTVFMYALGYADSIMSDEQEASMELIAYQAAVARACADYTIDAARLAEAVQGLDHVNAADLSPDQAGYAERLAMMSVGVAMGGFLAEFTLDPDAFCGGVDAFIAQAGEESLIAGL